MQGNFYHEQIGAPKIPWDSPRHGYIHKDSGKPNETRIITKKSEKIHFNVSSMPLQTKENNSQSNSSMQGLLGAYNDSDEEDDEDG